jgi:hypothetical protein
MPTVKKSEDLVEVKKEFIGIDDLSDEEIADLVEGNSTISDLVNLKVVETFTGNYDSSMGQENIVIFQRSTDSKMFRYIYMVDLSDQYNFCNIPELEEVTPKQETITIYE